MLVTQDESTMVRMPGGALIECRQYSVAASDVLAGDVLDDQFGRHLIETVHVNLCAVSGRPLMMLGERVVKNEIVHHMLNPGARVCVYRPVVEG